MADLSSHFVFCPWGFLGFVFAPVTSQLFAPGLSLAKFTAESESSEDEKMQYLRGNNRLSQNGLQPRGVLRNLVFQGYLLSSRVNILSNRLRKAGVFRRPGFPTRVADASDCNVEVTAWGAHDALARESRPGHASCRFLCFFFCSLKKHHIFSSCFFGGALSDTSSSANLENPKKSRRRPRRKSILDIPCGASRPVKAPKLPSQPTSAFSQCLQQHPLAFRA